MRHTIARVYKFVNFEYIVYIIQFTELYRIVIIVTSLFNSVVLHNAYIVNLPALGLLMGSVLCL